MLAWPLCVGAGPADTDTDTEEECAAFLPVGPFPGNAFTLIPEEHPPSRPPVPGLLPAPRSPFVPDLETCPSVPPVSLASASCAKARGPLPSFRLAVDFPRLPSGSQAASRGTGSNLWENRVVMRGKGACGRLRLRGSAEAGTGRALNARVRGLMSPYPVGGGTFPPTFSTMTPGKVGEETSGTSTLATAGALVIYFIKSGI